MKRKLVSIVNILILILLVAILIFFTNSKVTTNNEEKIKIVATIFPNYDFAKQIGGEKVEVKLLLGSGVESHTYEPTPKDMIEINNSNLFVFTGTEFEPWAKNILDASDNNLTVVDTSKNIELINIEDFERQNINSEIIKEDHEHKENLNGEINKNDHTHEENIAEGHTHDGESSYDSHIWLNPSNAIIMIDDILANICKIDPDNSEYYIQNAENYKKEILEIDNKFKKMITNSSRNEIAFAGEFSYTYFIEKYGLNFVSVYNNCGHGEDPSIAKVKSVIDYINNHKLPVVFYEELSEGTVAKMIGDETEAKAMVFYTIHNANIKDDNYVTLMEKNYDNLKEALN